MTATLIPGIGYVVQKDVVDERKVLPTLTTAEVATINARIAAGSRDYPAGTKVIEAETGLELTVQGVGSNALFANSAGVAPTAPIGGGVPAEVIQALQDALDLMQVQLQDHYNSIVSRLLPEGGVLGQVIVRAAFGPAWGSLSSGVPVIPVTPPPPAPPPSPAAYDYAASTTAANTSALNMRTKTAQLTN